MVIQQHFDVDGLEFCEELMKMVAFGVREGGSFVALANGSFGLLVCPFRLELRGEENGYQQDSLSEQRDHEELLHHTEEVAHTAGVVQAAVGLRLLVEVVCAANGDSAAAGKQLVPHGLEFGGWVGGGVVVTEGVGDDGEVIMHGGVQEGIGGTLCDVWM